MFNQQYMSSRRTLSMLRHAFRTGAARHDGYGCIDMSYAGGFSGHS